MAKVHGKDFVNVVIGIGLSVLGDLGSRAGVFGSFAGGEVNLVSPVVDQRLHDPIQLTPEKEKAPEPSTYLGGYDGLKGYTVNLQKEY